jgi:hypothetical protein
MMQRSRGLDYAKVTGYQAVALPNRGRPTGNTQERAG